MEIDGEPYRINTDFRAGIAYEIAAQAGHPINLNTLLSVFFPDEIPSDHEAVQQAVHEVITGPGPDCKTPKSDNKSAEPPPFSFAVDAAPIMAEFLRVYHIDLSTADMHWWRFRALLNGLITHDFGERVKYRCANPNDIKDRHVREQYMKLKRTYALDEHGQVEHEPQSVDELNEYPLKQARGEI